MSCTTEVGQYGEQRVLVIQTDAGSFKVFCSTVLRGLVERFNVQEADEVAIIYQGMKTGKRGRPFKMFTLAVDKAANQEQEEIPF